jgi:hypothetical protein
MTIHNLWALMRLSMVNTHQVISVGLRFRWSSYKCFITENTPSTYALLRGIENKKEMSLCSLEEGVGII